MIETMNAGKIKSYAARVSAAVLLIMLLWGCGRVPRLSEGIPPSSRLPFVRVLIDNGARQHTVSSAANDQMAIDCYKGSRRVSYYSRKPVIVSGDGNMVALYSDTRSSLDYNIDRVVISSRGKNPILSLDGKKYRGLVELKSVSGQLTMVNVVYMEDYLKGVVPLEIGPTPKEQFEAIKAQAVAARTYSMSHLGQYGDESGYDLKSDIGDQVYEGVHVENNLINKAIEATRGEVIVYRGKMIDAYYHSTCGGSTDDIEDVWEKDPAPYLRAVNDDDACSISKYFTWSERFSGDQLILRIEQYLSRARGKEARLGKLHDIRIIGRTPGGRVASIIFETTAGHFIFKKEEVRWVVRRSDNLDAILRSASFDLDIRRDADGNVLVATFTGRGYGHGVGMCQMGARGMAQNGITYDSILSLYYQGTELKRLY
jgi:stage II sporulation protein D